MLITVYLPLEMARSEDKKDYDTIVNYLRCCGLDKSAVADAMNYAQFMTPGSRMQVRTVHEGLPEYLVLMV